MCQFHMKQIVKRYITLNTRLLASRAQNEMMRGLTTVQKDDFIHMYTEWKETWKTCVSSDAK